MNRIYLILSFLINITTIYSQVYDATPCNYGKNGINGQRISKSRIAQEIPKLPPLITAGQSYSNYYDDWSSSILTPEGKPPKKTKLTEGYVGSIPNSDYIIWSCKYSPFYLSDHDPKTAWSEGVDGSGINEYVIAKVDVNLPIKIWAGFGINDKLFKLNNRPKDVTIYVANAFCASDHQEGRLFKNFIYIDKFSVTLQDNNNYQDINVPKKILELLNSKKPTQKDIEYCQENYINTFIIIRIDSVYKGEKYDDTLISEISN